MTSNVGDVTLYWFHITMYYFGHNVFAYITLSLLLRQSNQVWLTKGHPMIRIRSNRRPLNKRKKKYASFAIQSVTKPQNNWIKRHGMNSESKQRNGKVSICSVRFTKILTGRVAVMGSCGTKHAK